MSKRTIFLFAIVAVFQMCVAFWSWSHIPGNAAPGQGVEIARLVWDITSFPAFWLYRGYELFSVLFIIDGLLWSAVLVALWQFVRVGFRAERQRG